MNSMQDVSEVLSDTVGNAREVVHDTAATIRDAVAVTGDAVRSSVNSVRDTFDVRLQVQRHPWTAFGGATLAGFALGRLLESRGGCTGGTRTTLEDREVNRGPHGPMPRAFEEQPETLNARGQTIDPAGKTLSNVLANHLGPMKAFAIGSVMFSIKNSLGTGLPEEWRKPFFKAVDDITREFGGQPLADPVNPRGDAK